MAVTIRRTSMWIKLVILASYMMQVMSFLFLTGGTMDAAEMFVGLFFGGWMVRSFARGLRWAVNG